LSLFARNFDFSVNAPFNENDIVEFYPLIKYNVPDLGGDVDEFIETAITFMTKQPIRLDIAYEMLNNALAILFQITGPMNALVAKCFTLLAVALYHAGDIPQAIQNQKKAVWN
jgi:hypothetical protein